MAMFRKKSPLIEAIEVSEIQTSEAKLFAEESNGVVTLHNNYAMIHYQNSGKKVECGNYIRKCRLTGKYFIDTPEEFNRRYETVN